MQICAQQLFTENVVIKKYKGVEMKTIIFFSLSILMSIGYGKERSRPDKIIYEDRADFKPESKVIECESQNSDYKYLVNFMRSDKLWRAYDANGEFLFDGVNKIRVITIKVLNKKTDNYELKLYTGPLGFLINDWNYENPGLGLNEYEFFNLALCNHRDDMSLGLSMRGDHHFRLRCPDGKHDVLDLHLRALADNQTEMAGYFYVDFGQTKYDYLSNKNDFQKTKCQVLKK